MKATRSGVPRETRQNEMKITISEWRKALEAAVAGSGEDGMTALEISNALGVSIDVVRRRLTQLKADGHLIVGRGQREYLDGRVGLVPVYRPARTAAVKKP